MFNQKRKFQSEIFSFGFSWFKQHDNIKHILLFVNVEKENILRIADPLSLCSWNFMIRITYSVGSRLFIRFGRVWVYCKNIKTIESVFPQSKSNVKFFFTDFDEGSIDFIFRFWSDGTKNLRAIEVKSKAINAITIRLMTRYRYTLSDQDTY